MSNFQELEEMKVFDKRRKKFLSGSTNQILYNFKNKKTLHYMIPIYVRINVNSIANVDYRLLKA